MNKNMLLLKRFIILVTALLCCLSAGAAHALTDEYNQQQELVRKRGSDEDVAQIQRAKKSGKYKEITWDQLIPASWDPAKIFEKFNFDQFEDDDPKAEEALKQLQKQWSEAPINPALKGKLVKILGFVAPLDYLGGDELAEFLLVPYFGACIHVPPPPANQIIYVTLAKPRGGIQVMDAVWVYGRLEIEKNENDLADSGYSMKADAIEQHVE